MNSHKKPSRSTTSNQFGLTTPTRTELAPASSPSEAPRSGAKEGPALTAPTRTELAPASSPSEAPRSGAKEGPAFASTRTGKIARLPSSIRDQLNARLHDGESAATLLPWLNALPEVQTILTAQFAARPVTRQNLSEWRCGGFADWLALQESRAWLTRLREESAAFSQASGGDTPVSALLAAPLAVVLGRCFQQLAASASAKPAHLNRLLDLASALNRLRRSDHAESRLRLEHQRSQSALALADHRLLVEREHWKTAQAQAEIAAREKIESDKIKVEEDKIHRVRVAQRRARFYGADNPYAAMDAPYLAAASPQDHITPGHSPSPQTETSSFPPETRNPKLKTPPSLADQEAALERINALLARCAASSPTAGASALDSSTMAHSSPASVGPSLPDRSATTHAPSPQLETQNSKPETSSSPPSHPVAPNPTESNQQNSPTTMATTPAASLHEPASSSPSCLSC